MVTAQQEQVFVNAQVRRRDHRRACFCFVGEACSSEGKLECRALLVVCHAEFPVDLFETEKWININLYVQRVSIMVYCCEVMLVWLNFVKVIDCDGLLFNTFRETFQQNKILRVSSKKLLKMCFRCLPIAEKKDDYREGLRGIGQVHQPRCPRGLH